MNWGHKIIIIYSVFVAGMLFLAFKSSRQNTDLVTEDYYAKELLYQQKIDESKRTGLLSDSVIVDLTNNELTIRFPKDFDAKKITGDVALYCPSDEKKDINRQFTITDNMVVMAVPASYHGLHYVKISWSAAGIHYYFEKKIII